MVEFIAMLWIRPFLMLFICVIKIDIFPSSLYELIKDSKSLTFCISSINKYLKSSSIIFSSITFSNCFDVFISLYPFLSNSI